MTLFGRPVSAEDHPYVVTEHKCPCGRALVRAKRTTFLAGGYCGTTRYLIPATT